MYELYDWVYNVKLNLIGIITEKNAGRYNSEYAIYYPLFYEGHNGRGHSKNKYKYENLLFYTEDLMKDRIIPFEPRLPVIKRAKNYMKEDIKEHELNMDYLDSFVDIFF